MLVLTAIAIALLVIAILLAWQKNWPLFVVFLVLAAIVFFLRKPIVDGFHDENDPAAFMLALALEYK